MGYDSMGFAAAALVFLAAFLPVCAGSQEVAAVLSKASGPYLETFTAFQEAYGRPVASYDLSKGGLTLPNEVKMLFLGWSRLGTGLLVAAILFAIVGIVLLFLAGRARKPGFPALSGIVCITLTIVSMIVIRDMVRNAYLSVTGVNVAGYPVDMPVAIFALFALFLVVVIVAIIVMLRKALAPKAPETA